MNEVAKAIGRKVAHRGLILEKNSPTLLFYGGIAGSVASTVLACRATLQLDGVLLEGSSNLKLANAIDNENYGDLERRKDVSVIYVRTFTRVIKLYIPAVIVGTAAVAALTRSHHILSKRNAALTAAYAAIEKGFEEYRQRVIEKYGEEEDRNFRYATEEVEILEDGKKKTVTRIAPEGNSIYARFFDPLSPSWSREPEYNLVFIQCQQNYANDLLRARGHVFLNETYDMLGIPRSKAGAVVGWVLSGDGTTDNYIDFGVFDDKSKTRDFVNGREGSILLDFNVDGVIFDKIDTPKEALSWQMGN